MKRFLLLLLTLCQQSLFAEKAGLHPQLSNVNQNWNLHAELPENALRQFGVSPPATYHDWITVHLMLVEQNLRDRDVSQLSLTQKANRARLLNELSNYWKTGIYPVNDYQQYKAPVFIDRIGTHCAVGYLMQQSGHEVLARAIDANEKFAYVYEIKTPGVKQWADEFGFTVDELAWIQPTYAPTTQFAPVGNGSNGPVNVLTPNYYSGGLFIGGSFDTIGNVPCLNVGMYKNGQLGCYGGGVTGVVNDLYVLGNELLAAGQFIHAGVTYPLAIFNNSVGVWQYVDIPTVPGAVGKAAFSGGSVYKLELIISNPSNPGKDEIWYQKSNGMWEKQAMAYGVINDVEASYYGRIYAGSFDSLLVSRPTQTDTIVPAHNIVLKENYNSGWFAIPATVGNVSDTVLVVRSVGSAVYFGGVCSYSTGRSDVCLSRYLNGVIQPVFLSTSFDNWLGAVYDVELFQSNSLLVAGMFEFNPLGTSTKNIALYDLGLNYLKGYGKFDGTVRTITEWNDNWYFGGDFTADLKNPSLPHLATLSISTGINDAQESMSISVFPNPTSSGLSITTHEGAITQITVFDLAGREVLKQETNSPSVTISLYGYNSGLYLIKVLANGNLVTSRVVKY
jgi:hypothetical protein